MLKKENNYNIVAIKFYHIILLVITPNNISLALPIEFITFVYQLLFFGIIFRIYLKIVPLYLIAIYFIKLSS